MQSVVKRMRWKAMQFPRKLDQNGTEPYGFKMNKCLPAVEEVNEFESDLVLTVCCYHVMYAFQSESTLCICLNVKELLARNRCDI